MCRNRCTVCFTSLLHNYSSLPLYHWRRYDWLVASLLPKLGSNPPTGWWHGEGEICGACSRRHRKYGGYYVLGDGGQNVNRLHYFTISTPFLCIPTSNFLLASYGSHATDAAGPTLLFTTHTLQVPIYDRTCTCHTTQQRPTRARAP